MVPQGTTPAAAVGCLVAASTTPLGAIWSPTLSTLGLILLFSPGGMLLRERRQHPRTGPAPSGWNKRHSGEGPTPRLKFSSRQIVGRRASCANTPWRHEVERTMDVVNQLFSRPPGDPDVCCVEPRVKTDLKTPKTSNQVCADPLRSPISLSNAAVR